MGGGGGAGAERPGPPLSESHAPKNPWLSAPTWPTWRRRGKRDESSVIAMETLINKCGHSCVCVCVWCVCRKQREATNAQKNAQRAAMRAHFRRKYQLSEVGGAPAQP